MRVAWIALILALPACGPSSPPPAAAPTAAPVRITLFYADSFQVARGDEVLICYGVERAASVKIEPPVEQITPSFNRCFKYAPKATQEYTLIATGTDGSTARQSLSIRVEGVAVPKDQARLIGRFGSNSSEITAGQPVTLCFDAVNADEVKLDPPSRFPGGQMGCFAVVPEATTTYTLTARKGALKDSRKLTIKVKPAV